MLFRSSEAVCSSANYWRGVGNSDNLATRLYGTSGTYAGWARVVAAGIITSGLADYISLCNSWIHYMVAAAANKVAIASSEPY